MMLWQRCLPMTVPVRASHCGDTGANGGRDSSDESRWGEIHCQGWGEFTKKVRRSDTWMRLLTGGGVTGTHFGWGEKKNWFGSYATGEVFTSKAHTPISWVATTR